MVNDTAKGQMELRPLVQIQPHRSIYTFGNNMQQNILKRLHGVR